MKYLKKFKLLIILFTSTLFTCNNTENSKNSQLEYVQEIDAFIRQTHDEGLFNGNILVAKKDSIIYQESFGYTNASEKTKLSSASIFNIGSIAKEFNAVSIMILVEQGKLSLDDNISKFDLGFPEWSKKVTIRHLLNYVGGFSMPLEDVSSDKIALNNLKNLDKLLFEPGTDFNYNNYSIFIQQRIIEHVTGITYKTFVIQNIVKPLGMTSAVFDPRPKHPNRTSCYGLDKSECPEMVYISGWLWLNIDDLNKWIVAMNNNKIISQKSFETLLQNPFAKNKTSSIGEYFESIQLQRHNGTGGYKYKSVFLNDFKNDIIIVMLSNRKSNVVRTSARLHNLMLGKPYKSIAQAIKEKCIEDIELGIKAYYDLKNSSQSKKYPFDNPRELNRLAYELLRLEKIQEAIKIFQLEITEFPNEANGYDSLGEAYLLNKNYDLALKNYNKAIELGGTDGNAKKMVVKINKIITK